MHYIRLQEAKKRAKRHFIRRFPCEADGDIPGWKDATLQRMRKTGTSCSCWMCCNPRKLYGNSKKAKTVQELKQRL